jgi:hypothetical protein
MHDDGTRFLVIKVKGKDGQDALLRLDHPNRAAEEALVRELKRRKRPTDPPPAT